VVLWRVLMLEPAPARIGVEQLSDRDQHALDGLLHERGVRP